MKPLCLRKKNSNEMIFDRLEIADNFFSKLFGLLFKPCPEESEGLVFYNCSSIHMFFMRYPIGLLFLDKNGTILKMVNIIKPWRLCACKDGYITIETAPGILDNKPISIGDELEVI
ncbi:MAG: hypothetical protein COA79_13710 [Planctomycetota bacterium]|nr:MAG: hypothetical protein COA79_13710 [Planctomycetota bacterium]